MFNLNQTISEPTHNQGHLLDLVFSKRSDNIIISTKLHHGLGTSCAYSTGQYAQNLKLSYTHASKRLM